MTQACRRPRIDYVSLSMRRNDIGHTDKHLRIIGKSSLPLSIGRVEEPIISCIDGKGAIVIFLFWYLCANMYIFQCPRAPLIPNHHPEISCGRQYLSNSHILYPP